MTNHNKRESVSGEYENAIDPKLLTPTRSHRQAKAEKLARGLAFSILAMTTSISLVLSGLALTLVVGFSWDSLCLLLPLMYAITIFCIMKRELLKLVDILMVEPDGDPSDSHLRNKQ
jgi:hypothetical protein